MNQELSSALEQAVVSALEEMCFTAVMAPSALMGEPVLTAEVQFHGDEEGAVRVEISADAARNVSSGFLGTDDVTEASMSSVVLELTNIICGAMLSAFRKSGDFHLDPPELSSQERAEPCCSCSFELEVGTIRASVFAGVPLSA